LETFNFNTIKLDKKKFIIRLLKDAADFIEQQEANAQRKILYNMAKAQYVNDPVLFKKLNEQIWEFRTVYRRNYYRIFAFWVRGYSEAPVVISTHGVVKKSKKIDKNEIVKAESTRLRYLDVIDLNK